MATKEKKRLTKWLWALLSAVMIILLSVTSYAGYLYMKADQALDQISAPAAGGAAAIELPDDPSGPTIPEDGPQEAQERPIVMLLAGIDNRAGSDGSMNTDVLMLATLDKANQHLQLLSLPRDLRISNKLGVHKANYFYAYYYNRNRDTAIAAFKEVFSDLLQTEIDHVVMVNFKAFGEVVDALGGLSIDVPMNMRYVDRADGTDINLKKGLQTLNGKQVLDYVRYRKSNAGTAESSDLARNERQQEVLAAIIDKLTSFSSVTRLGELLEIMGDNVRTDIEKDQLRDWIFDASNMLPRTTDNLTLASTWDSPYIYVSAEDLITKLQQLREPLDLPPLDEEALLQAIGTVSP